MTSEIIGFVFAIIVGTLGHFLYEYSGYNKCIGFLFSKNESIFEHIKLGVTPILLWTIIELLTKNYKNLFFAKFFSIIIFTFSLLILYTLYKSILKKNILFLDILIFYISLFLSTITSIIINKFNYNLFLNIISLIGIIFIIYIYILLNKKN